MEKTGRYTFLAEPFHCDFSHRLFMGHLGNHLLNAADFHSADRNFGMTRLNPIHRTWVLSRLAIEMDEMPAQYSRFTVETWVESAMRYFTNRNFHVVAEDGRTLGYGRSVWAMIDTDTRQPADLLAIDDGAINAWIDKERPCPIAKSSRAKVGKDAPAVRTIETRYSDVDVNGHVNSIKYVEHTLDLFPLDWYKEHMLHRIEIAYVAESHAGDRLTFYREEPSPLNYNVRITKGEGDNETEVCRCCLVKTQVFVKEFFNYCEKTGKYLCNPIIICIFAAKLVCKNI